MLRPQVTRQVTVVIVQVILVGCADVPKGPSLEQAVARHFEDTLRQGAYVVAVYEGRYVVTKADVADAPERVRVEPARTGDYYREQ